MPIKAIALVDFFVAFARAYYFKFRSMPCQNAYREVAEIVFL